MCVCVLVCGGKKGGGGGQCSLDGNNMLFCLFVVFVAVLHKREDLYLCCASENDTEDFLPSFLPSLCLLLVVFVFCVRE